MTRAFDASGAGAGGGAGFSSWHAGAELVQSAVVTVSGELNLEVQLIPLDWAETREEKETGRSS
jgi:hypothetical protein